MELNELREALEQFSPEASLMVAIPTLGGPYEARAVHLVGHLDHSDEVKTDHLVHALDIVCDHWSQPRGPAGLTTVGDLLVDLEQWAAAPQMHVRVAVPVTEATHSHRMLDISMLGHAAGAGGGVQIITESWANPMQILKEFPHVVAARQRAAAAKE